MSKFYKCEINEQDGLTEKETYMYFELPDTVSHTEKVLMLDNFLLDWYSDGDWEDEANKVAWFPSVNMSVALDVDEITEADWRVLVKHSYNSTTKFLLHLPKSHVAYRTFN